MKKLWLKKLSHLPQITCFVRIVMKNICMFDFKAHSVNLYAVIPIVKFVCIQEPGYIFAKNELIFNFFWYKSNM